MMVKGRVVAVLLILTIAISSFTTYVVLETNELLHPSLQTPVLPDGNDSDSKESAQNTEEVDKFLQAYEKIQSAYFEPKTKQELIDGAIRGMIESLNDPHSTYMDQKEAEDFFSTLSDSFEGIGAEVTMENGRVTVVAPIKDSPSEKAGIKPKDQIIKINGESLEGLSLFESVNKIRGPKGTKAKLEIIRPGLNEPITITVVRDEIPIETVHSKTISSKTGLLGLIEITNFGEKTAEDFELALKGLEKKNIKGLIIDLRGNPGGYLQSVVHIGNLVIPNHGTIVQIEDRDKKRQAYTSDMGEAKYPIVALIDKGSASASEILAAALQEAGKYPVIGEPSYGKGTVQNPYELKDGSNMKLTVAKWLTPKGNWIHQKGVQPDISISQPDYFHAMPFSEDILLKRDMNDVQVENLQLILNGLGYKTGRSDGYFDKNTELAVIAFQKANGLKSSGIVDQKTSEVLVEKLIHKIQDPASDLQLQAATETLTKNIR